MSLGFTGHSMHDTRGSAYDKFIRLIGKTLWEMLKKGAAQGPISREGPIARSKRDVGDSLVDNKLTNGQNQIVNGTSICNINEAQIEDAIRTGIFKYEEENREIYFSDPEAYERIALNIAAGIVIVYAAYKTPSVVSGLWNLGKCAWNYGITQTWNSWENSIPNSKNSVSINGKKNTVLLSINVLKNLIGELENLEKNRTKAIDVVPNSNANEVNPLVKKEFTITALDYSGKQKDYSLTEEELKSVANMLHDANFSAGTSRALGDVNTQTA